MRWVKMAMICFKSSFFVKKRRTTCKLQNSVSYFWYCSLSYFVKCSAEKAVRYDREQVEKDGTEFSHLQVVLPAGLDEAVDFC
jgi:hypothetical protein